MYPLKGDYTQIAAVSSYLAHTCNIPKCLIKTNHSLVLCGNTIQGLFAGRVNNLIRSKCIIHTPDIVVLNNNGTLRFVIEIDGAVHDTWAGRRTILRDKHYKRCGVVLCKIDIKSFRVSGVSWFDHIRRYL